MGESYLKIGSYTPETEDQEAVLDRGYYRQGWIFKDEEAFRLHPEQVCYVPELSDEGYTRQDFLAMCNGQEEVATLLFESVDWQSPETLLNELYDTYELEFCPVCQKNYFMAGEQIPCPICGYRPDEGEENADTESEVLTAEPAAYNPAPGFEARRQGL